MDTQNRAAGLLISISLIFLVGCGAVAYAAGAPAADRTAFTCVQPNSDVEIELTVALPKAWARNTGFGTVVFEPGDAGDYYEAPNLEIQALCEGECAPAAIPGNIETYVQRLREGWKTLSTGNEELDQRGATVEVLADRREGNARILAVSLTYPEGVSSSMYPPRLWIYRLIHDPGKPYFIMVKGKVPADLKAEFFDKVQVSCESVVAE